MIHRTKTLGHLILATICMLSVVACGPSTHNDAPADHTPSTTNTDNSSSNTPKAEPAPKNTPSSTANINEEAALKDIREKFAAIREKVETEQTRIQEVEYYCDDWPREGTIQYHFDGNHLCMIEHSYNEGDHYGRTDQLYVWNDSLFFVFSEYGSWMFDGDASGDENSQPETVDENYEERFYFYQGVPFNCLKKYYQVYSRKKVNPSAQEVPNEKVPCTSEATEWNKEFSDLIKLMDKELQDNECPFDA